ncbi:general odorant-binding protein 56h [Scaptodrosophila lebanonensis]|uniref:General odorant-binding protein 56h n=1 Tax=Drosophila lebanonensis TaxID=7225 RepID=A0A6J2U968_DROLE|nr:general odorant-binding protein 56h [Scaptodrosophila lebanonensis]
MKATVLLTLLLGCLAATLADDAEIQKTVASCMKENGVTPQEVADLKSGKTKPEDIKDNVKCATQCLFVKSGFMDAKGALLTDAVNQHFADTPIKDDVAKAMAACGSVTGANPCDAAFQTMICIQEHGKGLVI